MFNPTPDTARDTINGLLNKIRSLTAKPDANDDPSDEPRAWELAETDANELLIAIRRVNDHVSDKRHGWGPTLEAAG